MPIIAIFLILDNNVLVVQHFNDSAGLHSGFDEEGPVSEQSVVFIPSFVLLFLLVIKIEDLPSLVQTVVQCPDEYLLAFSILSSGNINHFLVLDIDDIIGLILEDLEPSAVGVPHLQVVLLSSVLNVDRFLLVLHRFDGLSLLIEVPLLGLVSVWCLDYDLLTANKV